MHENQELVPVASFESLSEAEVALGLLEAEGIEAVVQDRPLASLLPPIALANGGLVLLVLPDELEKAREVLAAPDAAGTEDAPLPPGGAPGERE
ncbi:putative signal transducing protein [Anaeromyxobacter sp. PSR-1]|uniref:putative signal transducing protein n=1 Tax=unclassified Anaeromyxobacter TaxID=2620896 RepID=UPI0005E56387|nr:DUF2007 domain-containing protein [Anaeromyxobacter sp. PSR-1]GAO04018.1 hypothetical protein PSR1_02906 [Anaeromyxobacter sp. PSR-1]